MADDADRIARVRAHLATVAPCEVTYHSAWLGYLPYGAYHWLEVDRVDVTAGMPADWQREDLFALERAGFLDKIDEQRDPAEPHDVRIVFRVNAGR
jgi:hypothetical protein